MTLVNRRSALRTLSNALLLATAGRAVPVWAQATAAGGPAGTLTPDAASVLLIIDVQNCFVAGGTLAVKGGADVVPIINKLAPAFPNVVMTQDWHPPHHASFASSYPGRHPFETTRLSYGTQVLWPDHCVQGTADAELDPALRVPNAQLILRKGYHPGVDSYSAFEEADRKTPTGLKGYLRNRGITKVFVCGLATDFCVAWTALDARAAEFDTYVIEDACRGIDIDGSLAAAWARMQAKGVKRIQSSSIDAAIT